MSLAAPRAPLGRLADVVVRRRRAVLLGWVVALAAALGATSLAGDWSADYNTPGSESKAAADLLAERFPQRSADTVDVVWQSADGAAAAPATARIDALLTEARRLEGIGAGARAAQAELSPDGTVGVVRLPLTESPGAVPIETGAALLDLAEAASAGGGPRVALGGNVVQNAQQGEISSEAVGLAIAAGVLAAHLRLRRGGRTAARRRAVRARHLLRAGRPARRGDRRARLGARHVGDGGDRRRRRLRAAHRHALPGRAGRGPRHACRGRRRPWPRPGARS